MRVEARPIQSVNERGELRSREPHYAITDRRPSKRALLKPFPKQHKAGPVPGQNFQTIRSFRTEDEDRAGEGIALELFARQRGKTVSATPEVYRLRRHQHPLKRIKITQKPIVWHVCCVHKRLNLTTSKLMLH